MTRRQQRQELEEKLRQAEEGQKIFEAKLAAARTATAIPKARRISHYDTPEEQFSRKPAYQSLGGMLVRACGAKSYVSPREARVDAMTNRMDRRRKYYY